MIEIVQIAQITDEVVSAFTRLIPQLSSIAVPPTRDELEKMVASNSTSLIAGRETEVKGAIVGVLSLVIYRIPSGVQAWIEDVVVDANARQRGIGEKLIRFALERAQKAGARYVDLTSRPARTDAIRLYQKLGFKQRETSVYRFRW